MNAGKHNITIRRRRDFIKVFTIVDDSVDMSSWEIAAAIGDGEVVLVPFAVSIDALAKTFTLSLSAEETADLPASNLFQYDVKITTVGVSATWIYGNVEIINSITQ